MRTRRALVALVVLASALALGAACARDARAQDLPRLFPEEADVFVDAPGMARLPLPPAVVAACTPDLADLRLFDPSGREVPYLVDPGVPGGRERRAHLTADARVLDLEREEIPRDGAPALTREVYRVALPEGRPVGESWSVVVGSRQPRYVRSVEVRGVGADGVEVPLVSRASLVRLGQALVDRDRVPLPPFDGVAIEVAIEGEEGFFLEPELRFESERRLGPGDASEVSLAIVAQGTSGGRTVLELDRPPALVAARLVLASTTPAFDRSVTVYDVAADGTRREIGRGRMVRAPLGDEVDERLDVAIGRAHGERLRVEIEDGDSPPLAEPAVRLAYDAPTLLFALPPAAAGAPAGVLRFGGGRAYAPRYDVAGLFRDPGPAGVAVLGAAATLPLARLGDIRPNPRFDASPALAPLMQAGATVQVDEWRWRRPLTVPPSPEGLVRLRLTPDDVARAQDRHGDLRVVDAGGRQWPYLVAPADESADLPLALDGPRTEGGRSRWRLALAGEAVPVERIVLQTTRPVLGRRFRLRATAADGDERVIAEGTLEQDLRRPEPLTIATDGLRAARFELEVEDGDDAPIALSRAEAVVALPSLLIAAPPGSYTLLAGNPDAEAPRYEITRAREVVLDLRTVAAETGAGADHAGWTGVPGGRARRSALLQRLAVWSAIGVAVAVLGFVTLRMVRRPG